MPSGNFSLPFGEHTLIGDCFTPLQLRGTALLLHGAGSSTAEGFADLRSFLNDQGIGSAAFDCIGHGRTGGLQLGTSLAQRVAQVEAVAQSLGRGSSELTVIGFSMGAYVAVQVAAAVGANGLGLAVPAAYAPDAFNLPFGPAFTAVLRRPGSWSESNAFDRISQYTGHLLVLSAERDQIVPGEIPHRYVSSARQARSTRHHVVARAGHSLSKHYDAEPAAREAVHQEIAALCLRAAHPTIDRPLPSTS